ncbi:MAG TPA: hypothetical protein ENI68_11250 [Gammaproteobacteria bacterium]|nr:hypothetical protein [Gammaproteobacteria bacterium]
MSEIKYLLFDSSGSVEGRFAKIRKTLKAIKGINGDHASRGHDPGDQGLMSLRVSDNEWLGFREDGGQKCHIRNIDILFIHFNEKVVKEYLEAVVIERGNNHVAIVTYTGGSVEDSPEPGWFSKLASNEWLLYVNNVTGPDSFVDIKGFFRRWTELQLKSPDSPPPFDYLVAPPSSEEVVFRILLAGARVARGCKRPEFDKVPEGIKQEASEKWHKESCTRKWWEPFLTANIEMESEAAGRLGRAKEQIECCLRRGESDPCWNKFFGED